MDVLRTLAIFLGFSNHFLLLPQKVAVRKIEKKMI